MLDFSEHTRTGISILTSAADDIVNYLLILINKESSFVLDLL